MWKIYKKSAIFITISLILFCAVSCEWRRHKRQARQKALYARGRITHKNTTRKISNNNNIFTKFICFQARNPCILEKMYSVTIEILRMNFMKIIWCLLCRVLLWGRQMWFVMNQEWGKMIKIQGWMLKILFFFITVKVLKTIWCWCSAE